MTLLLEIVETAIADSYSEPELPDSAGARAAIAALKAEGWAVVPRAATEEMRLRAANPSVWPSFEAFWDTLVEEFEIKTH